MVRGQNLVTEEYWVLESDFNITLITSTHYVSHASCLLTTH